MIAIIDLLLLILVLELLLVLIVLVDLVLRDLRYLQFNNAGFRFSCVRGRNRQEIEIRDYQRARARAQEDE